MITKETADKLLTSLEFAYEFLESLPSGWLSKTTGDIGALNDFYCSKPKVLIEKAKEEQNENEI